MLGIAQLAVGAAAIFARYALGGAAPLAVAAGRLTIATAAIALGFALHPVRVPTTRRQRLLLALAGVMLAAHFSTWIMSLDYTNVAISTLLVTTTPIWTATYDAIVLKRPLTAAALAAFVTGGIGLVLVVGFDRTAPPFPGHEVLGASLALIGSVAIGAYFTIVREVREALPTRTIVSHTYSWASVVLIAAALIARQPPPPLGNVPAWGGIMAMALVSQLLGHTILNACVRWFSPSAIAFATLIEPVIAASLALVIFAEPVPPLAITGGVIVLLSIGVVLREEARSKWTGPRLDLDRSI